jgi:lysophospholipase L1-like esterase
MKTLLIFPLVAVFCCQVFSAEPAFTLKDNDIWVMAGDSITAQRLHSNYIEAFFRTRYPQWHLHFRNSGIGGNRTSHIFARFDYDVAAWKPTIVSIELGMNDVGGRDPDSKDAPAEYVDGMKKLADDIRAIKAQPVFISSSPVNDGSVMDAWVSIRCRTIHPFTEALKELGQKEGVLVVDQYHPLINLWGPNKILEDAGSLATRVRLFKPGNNIPDLNTLQSFAKTWEGKPMGISLGVDSVHTGPVGQYTMAATILEALDADREVSSATLKPDGTVVAAKSCKITDVMCRDGRLSFVRLDDRSPWPLLPSAAPALKLMPEIADLSRYILTIQGLPTGNYRVAINGKNVATLNNNELEKGWNMGAVTEGPLGERATKILNLINELQGSLNYAWRDASKTKNAEKLVEIQKGIDECEAKIQVACQPEPLRFEIEVVK